MVEVKGGRPRVYKITGDHRKLLKQELRRLKYFVKMFWFNADLEDVHGHGLSDCENQKILDKVKKEMLDLENVLAEKI